MPEVCLPIFLLWPVQWCERCQAGEVAERTGKAVFAVFQSTGSEEIPGVDSADDADREAQSFSPRKP